MSELSLTISAGSVRPITVPPISADTVILPGDSYLHGWSLMDQNSTTPEVAQGSVIAPAAGVTIAAINAIPVGWYDVRWTVSLDGAPAAGEIDNFKLVNSGLTVALSDNPDIVGEFPQAQTTVFVPAAGFLVVKNVNAGTAGVTYSAEITATPSNVVTSQFQVMDGSRVVGAGSMTPGGCNTENFGPLGLRIYTGITIHVIAGTIAGTVNAMFDKAS